ncbi:hypothetical protein M0R45_005558 [Rubus argutus]|uniref:Uncharacterized protein n=1 Tax=Rubus argutus TaxID=59490 RepID=A0AAW1YMZ6_RUBAR
MQEGSNALSSMLLNSQCCLKVLVLQKCRLGISGVLRIIQVMVFLEELNLADNADLDKQCFAPYDMAEKGSLGLSQPNYNVPESSPPVSVPYDVNQLEVADSEDDEVGVEAATSTRDESGSSSRICDIWTLAKMVSPHKAQSYCILHGQDQDLFQLGRHIKDKTIHFFVEGMKCCVRPCCRKD